MKQHGGMIYDSESRMLDFSANIHPRGIPQEMIEAMEQALKESHYYPDPECTQLRQAISVKHGADAEHILCGNGAADLIFHLAFALEAEKILLPVPAFTEYEEAFLAASHGKGQIEEYPMDPETFLIGEDILERMDDSVDLLVLCNPNNPTGRLVPQEMLLRMLEEAREKEIRVLLDECFLDFTEEGSSRSLIPQYRRYPHAFILKSFTKMYGIAGIRLGYGICADAQLLKRIRHTMQTWGVSHVAQAAGIAACRMDGYEERTAAAIARERSWMLEQMRSLGLWVLEGSANYLFFRARGCTDLDRICREKNICIRHCGNYRGLGNDYYRVAVRSREENRELIRALREWKEGNCE